MTPDFELYFASDLRLEFQEVEPAPNSLEKEEPSSFDVPLPDDLDTCPERSREPTPVISLYFIGNKTF